MTGLQISLWTYLITAVVALFTALIIKGLDMLLVILPKEVHQHHADEEHGGDDDDAKRAIAIAAAHSKQK